MKELLKGLNEAAKRIHAAAKEKGFYNTTPETGTALMLVVSELSEAMEADRNNHKANREVYEAIIGKGEKWDAENFEFWIKDTHEDEITDAIIRLLDYAGFKNIDIEWHIREKLAYNLTRPHKHGKKY